MSNLISMIANLINVAPAKLSNAQVEALMAHCDSSAEKVIASMDMPQNSASYAEVLLMARWLSCELEVRGLSARLHALTKAEMIEQESYVSRLEYAIYRSNKHLQSLEYQMSNRTQQWAKGTLPCQRKAAEKAQNRAKFAHLVSDLG